MQKQTSRKYEISKIVIVTTIFFGINTLIPLAAIAQTSTSATIGQTVDASAGALTLPCALGNFSISSVDLNAPNAYFSGYYLNPLTPDANLVACGGTGITVQDTRYAGGFVLQVSATSYLKDSIGPEDINVDTLSIVTEQISSSYLEDTSGASTFVGAGDGLLTGSTLDNVVDENTELTQTLPFDFTLYGTTYTSGSTLYICTNGMINFTSSECDAPIAALENILTDTDGGGGNLPRLLPYYKDLTTDTSIDASYGVYYVEPDASTVRIRWKGAPCVADDITPTDCETAIGEDTEFEVLLTDNDTEDTVTYNYGSAITDSQAGPIIGVTKGGEAGSPISNTYTESRLSQQMTGLSLTSTQAIFSAAGANFTEAVKPGTPVITVPASGDQAVDIDYLDFTEDGGNPGNSLAMDIINATANDQCGRVGLYTIYPSYKLNVPLATVDGAYTSTITYTLSDSSNSGAC